MEASANGQPSLVLFVRSDSLGRLNRTGFGPRIETERKRDATGETFGSAG
jgi:hypothetical protein